MLITGQHTSISFPFLSPILTVSSLEPPVVGTLSPLVLSHRLALGCQPIRLGTAHRRSRCTQGSRETDESTLRPRSREETFRFALFRSPLGPATLSTAMATLPRVPRLRPPSLYAPMAGGPSHGGPGPREIDRRLCARAAFPRLERGFALPLARGSRWGITVGVTRRWGDFGTCGEGDVAASFGVLVAEGCGELSEGRLSDLHGGSFEGGGREVCLVN